MNMLSYLNEVTYKELRAKTDLKSRDKSKRLPSGTKFINMKDDILYFSTESQTHPGTGLQWVQKIKLLDLNKLLADSDDTTKLLEIARKSVAGDLAVSCTCPAFVYWGYAYILTKLDAIEGKKEDRKPTKNNVALKGSVCKHLDSALVILPFLSSSLVKYMKDS